MTVNLIEIIRRMDMTVRELAKEAHITTGTILELQAGAEPSLPVRRKIESALDQAIWSTPTEYMEWRKLRRLFGCEPYLLTEAELRRRASAAGVKGHTVGSPNKEQLILAIAARLSEMEKRAKEAQSIQPPNPEEMEKINAYFDRFLNALKWRCQTCKGIFEPRVQNGNRVIPRKCRICGSSKVLPVIEPDTPPV